jgi:hypothetical protein
MVACDLLRRWGVPDEVQFGKLVADETAKRGKVIRAANIKAE